MVRRRGPNAPHPNPLPVPGRGSDVAQRRGQARLPLPLAGEGWGEGVAGYFLIGQFCSAALLQRIMATPWCSHSWRLPPW